MKNEFVFGCDIDDCIADLVPTWINKYNVEYNDILDKSMINEWNISKFIKSEAKEKFYNYLTPALYDDIKPITGSLDAIKRIKKAGIRVIFITTFNVQHPGRKYKWLLDYGFLKKTDIPQDYIETTQKQLVLTTWLLDDNFDNIKSFRGKGLLFNQPWNQKFYWQHRFDNWERIANYVIGELDASIRASTTWVLQSQT